VTFAGPPDLGGNVIQQRWPVVKRVDAYSMKVRTLKAQDGGVFAARDAAHRGRGG
jgi:hypothetical protein